MAMLLHGLGVSRGIAIGKTHVIHRNELFDVTEKQIPEAAIEQEIKRLNVARTAIQQELNAMLDQLPSSTAAGVREFIGTNLLMLQDDCIIEETIAIIRDSRCCAAWAIKKQRDSLIKIFDEMEDPYLKTRKDDIDHVASQIIRKLNHPNRPLMGSHEQAPSGTILVINDLSPAETIQLRQKGITALVLEHGGPTSHTSILAKSLNLPTIVGVHGATRLLKNDEQIIVDGNEGVVLATDDPTLIDEYRRIQAENERRLQTLRQQVSDQTTTLDHRSIDLLSNIELAEEAQACLEAGSSGVGLFRTEFLFMNRKNEPDENEQLAHYRQVATTLKAQPVTIRTLDIGSDKQLNGQPFSDVINPALGLRAIRYCLKNKPLFSTQIRAILRASHYGNVRLLLPLLTSPSELTQALAVIEDCKQQLKQEGLPFDEKLQIGGMIEVPGAALIADQLATHLDFFSIGTNDLIQYTLAVDRLNDEVSDLYNTPHPAILKLIRMVVASGKRAQIPVSLCGEMAGETRYTRLLLGLGLTQLSMLPCTILDVRQMIQQSDSSKLQDQVNQFLDHNLNHSMEDFISQLNKD